MNANVVPQLMEYPEVSIIVPCRNEERHIANCLNSILSTSYPHEHLEILVLDGQSEDRTREIVEGYSQRYPFIKVLHNPKRSMPAGSNIGIANAKGDLIMIMGAHTEYSANYIVDSVTYSVTYSADNVGGRMRTYPSRNTFIAKAACCLMSSRFGAGAAKFRSGGQDIQWVDTVFGGCYRRDVFERIGVFDEKLVRGQDREFNNRLRSAGGRILYVPQIECSYYTYGTLRQLTTKMFLGGYWVFYGAKIAGRGFGSLRNWIPLLFFVSIVLFGGGSFASPWARVALFSICGVYLVAALCATLPCVIRERDARLLPVLPVLFGMSHLLYGAGALCGIVKGWFTSTQSKRVDGCAEPV